MCGIAGQIGRDPRVIQGQYAAYCAMQQTLSRRGPDQRGMFISGRAALIHARLAVVDIENGLQPMQLDWQGESYTLVYNGELYNTPELRAALQNRPGWKIDRKQEQSCENHHDNRKEDGRLHDSVSP